MKTIWTTSWQNELLAVLRLYDRIRLSHRCFFLYLLAFFFVVNAACYWLAVLTAFPDMLRTQLGRTAVIQQPVAVLGGLFDSLSFFVTVHLVKRASVARTGLKLVGILAIDLLIAAVATAWVLLVVMMTSWAVGPPDTVEGRPAATVTIVEPEQRQDGAESTSPPGALPADVPALPSLDEDAGTGPRDVTIATPGQPDFDAGFYQDLVVDALQNPGANIKYFLFGVIMGLSTLLPSGFHLWMAAKSFRKANNYG